MTEQAGFRWIVAIGCTMTVALAVSYRFYWPGAKVEVPAPAAVTPYPYDEPMPASPVTIDGCIIIAGPGMDPSRRWIDLSKVSAFGFEHHRGGGPALMFDNYATLYFGDGGGAWLPLPVEQQDAFTRAWKECRK